MLATKSSSSACNSCSLVALLSDLVKIHISVDCFVCFVALRLKSTAMVMVGRSVHLTTLFPGQA